MLRAAAHRPCALPACLVRLPLRRPLRQSLLDSQPRCFVHSDQGHRDCGTTISRNGRRNGLTPQQINGRVLECDGADKLLTLYAESHQQMNAVNVSTLWVQLQRSQISRPLLLHSDLVVALLQHTQSLHHEFGPQALGNILHALGKLAHRHRSFASSCKEASLALMTEAAVRRSELKPQGLANVLYAFGLLAPHGVVAAEACGLLVTEAAARRSELRPQDLSNTLYAFGLMAPHGVVAAEACGVLVTEAAAQRSELNEQSLANTLYACALMDLRHQALEPASPLWQRIVAAGPILTAKAQCQLHQTLMWRRALQSEPALPEPLRRSLHEVFASQPTTASRTEQELCGVLSSPEAEGMGIHSVASDHRTAEGFSIDVHIERSAGTPFLVEFDGPSHFLQTPMQGGTAAYASIGHTLKLNSPTAFKHRVLRALGHRLVSVGFREWGSLPRAQSARLQWLLDRMDAEEERHASMSVSNPPSRR